MSGGKGLTERRFQGTPVSAGVVKARAFIVSQRFEEPELREVASGEREEELERFEKALGATRSQIIEMQQQIAGEIDGAEARIFDAHLLMLEDRTVLDEVVRQFRQAGDGIETVFYRVLKRYTDSLRKLDDPYLKERVVDIEDVGRRVIRNLGEHRGESENADFEHILIAHNLTPSDTAMMDRSKVLGFATEMGGTTSHTAIMARSLNIPAVVGCVDLCGKLRKGELVILDGYRGLIIASPTRETLAEYETFQAEKDDLQSRLAELRDTKCRSRDGKDIILSANVELEEELPMVTRKGAEGIGLYRTEFLYLNSPDLPTEEEQLAVYQKVVAAAGPDGVIIRTFDLGGDKLHSSEEEEIDPNPFLGWRGIRVSLSRPEMFKTQLRAILQASASGRVGVMFPLVSGIGEVKRANTILAECMVDLKDEGIPFDPDIEIGVMIEVPSAALLADMIAPHVDFFSIGTNDLVQYTLAVDRVNERVADLYQPTHPAVVKLLKLAVDAAKKNGIWVGVCGEMAGDVVFTPLMLGLGMDELSVGGGQLPQVKHAVQCLDSTLCEEMVAGLAKLDSPEAIYETCREMACRYYPELLR